MNKFVDLGVFLKGFYVFFTIPTSLCFILILALNIYLFAKTF